VVRVHQVIPDLLQVLSEDEVPCTAEETQTKLAEQRSLLSTLEEEQRNLEYSFRSLNRSIPQVPHKFALLISMLP